MRKAKDPFKARKRRIVIGVIIEIIVMSVGVLCCILPLPWRLVVPIIIGAREIILKTYRMTHNNPQKLRHSTGAMPKRSKK